MQQVERFFDAETGGEARLELRRDGAHFVMLRQLGYRDPLHGEPFIVPKNLKKFRTDLASIPWFFAWLVPGLGTHLPAVIVHDALVVKPGESKSHIGPNVDREEADRILRDAMASLGTPLIRRWLMWTAVIMATAMSVLRPRWYWPALVITTLLTIGVLGCLATIDLIDAADVLPWMGDRPWFVEMYSGAMFAVLIPLAISVLWRRLWKAGAIAGVTLALLLHVTAAVVSVYGIYWIAEWFASRREGATPNVTENLKEIAAYGPS